MQKIFQTGEYIGAAGSAKLCKWLPSTQLSLFTKGRWGIGNHFGIDIFVEI